MLTIGEFSRICRVSTKTLRYYETMGLLQPWLVNPANGYRFYTADQLGTMRLINRLKAYNFTLEEIKLLVVTFNGERSSLSAALQEKKQELLRQKTLLNQRLRQLDGDIENLRQGCSLANAGDEIVVELTEMPAMMLLSRRLKVREGDFPQAHVFCGPVLCAQHCGRYYLCEVSEIRSSRHGPGNRPLPVHQHDMLHCLP